MNGGKDNAQICRVLYNEKTDEIEFESAIAQSTDLDEIIESDKRFGVMVPANGDHFTYRIDDTKNGEVTIAMLNRAIGLAWTSWRLRLNFNVKRAVKGEYADFRAMFRSPATDERKFMTNQTIMYAYYPVSNLNDPNRGLCVINPNFYFTVDGKPLSLHIIDPKNYPEPTDTTGRTIDLDAVLRHEFGHLIGLQHDPIRRTTMFAGYGGIAEFLTDRDIARGVAKYGKKNITENRLIRWLKWLFVRSENY